MKLKLFFLLIIFLIILNKILVFSDGNTLDIKLIFQNPSYLLEKNIENTTNFTCDITQSECKVNYNLEVNEGSGYISTGTKYICEWDFGLGFTTGEESKCNPNTIIYQTGSFKTTYKVKLKTNENIFYYNEIFINNGTFQENIEEENTSSGDIIGEETSSGELLEESTNSGQIIQEENTGSGENIQENTNSGGIIQEEIIQDDSNTGVTNTGNISISSQIFLLFQSPSYLLEKDQSGTLNYNCDNSKTDCRVNFNLNIDEGSGAKSIDTKYICEWNFGFSEFEEEKSKCNPNTITYPIGEFQTTFKISEKSNTGVFFEKKIFIKNTGYMEPKPIIKTVTLYNTINQNSNLDIEIPKIIIQSGIDQSNNCKNQDCSINLNYEIKNSKESCLWSFPGGSFENGTDKKCNPGYVKYPLGDFKVTLRVYEIGNENNFKESYLYFSNKKQENIKDEKLEHNNEELGDNEEPQEENVGNADLHSMQEIDSDEILKNYTLKITKISPNPIGADNLEFIEIQNIGSEEIDLKNCSFDDKVGEGSKEFIFKDSYIIKPNQTKKFYKYDTRININNSGKEQINLFCHNILIDNISWDFKVSEGFILSKDLDLNLIKDVKKQKNKNIYEVNYRSGEKKIISFDESFDVINDLIGEDLPLEEKKQKLFELVEKSFYQKISKQKSGVKIYGTTIPNTKIIFKLEKIQDEFSFLNLFYKKSFALNDVYETFSDKNGNYEFYIKNPNIGEFELKTFLNFGEDNNFELPKKSSLEIDSDYLEYINSSKNIEKQENEYIKPKSIITLQGRVTSNKTFSNNKLVCFGVNECSVNFDGSKSEGTNLEYFWDFGNGKTFNKKNPSSYKFPLGKYIISLTVRDENTSDTSYFLVDVDGKKSKEKSQKQKVENKITKNNKIDIIQTANAQDIKKYDVKTHIFLSLSLILIFILGALILLKRKKII